MERVVRGPWSVAGENGLRAELFLPPPHAFSRHHLHFLPPPLTGCNAKGRLPEGNRPFA